MTKTKLEKIVYSFHHRLYPFLRALFELKPHPRNVARINFPSTREVKVYIGTTIFAGSLDYQFQTMTSLIINNTAFQFTITLRVGLISECIDGVHSATLHFRLFPFQVLRLYVSPFQVCCSALILLLASFFLNLLTL